MPNGISGIELGRQTRIVHPDLGFIYISGYADAVRAAGEELDEGDFVLTKPFTPDDLAEAVRIVLDERAVGAKTSGDEHS